MSGILTVTPMELFSVLKGCGEGLCLLDVREPDEFLEGHVTGAESAPLSAFLLWKDQLEPETYIYLYSRTDRRAMVAAKRLISERKNVWVLEGGLEAWKAGNLPVEMETSLV